MELGVAFPIGESMTQGFQWEGQPSLATKATIQVDMCCIVFRGRGPVNLFLVREVLTTDSLVVFLGPRSLSRGI